MVKKLGLSIVGLAAVLGLAAPRHADAAVRFGVSIGTPVYSYPAPAPVDPYAYNYGYGYDYQQPYVTPVYPYSAPAYVAPRWNDHEWHERLEHREHERHEHERGDRGNYRGGWRR